MHTSVLVIDDEPELAEYTACLLYTSEAADDLLSVDLGGRRIIKKKTLTILSNKSLVTTYTYTVYLPILLMF